MELKIIPQFPEYKASRCGQIYSINEDRFLLIFPRDKKSNYQSVVLYKKKIYYVHRLVAMAWIENKENAPMVNHKNGCKHDNKVENLEWVTAKQNMLHAVRNKLFIVKRGFENKNSKLTKEQVIKIKTLLKDGNISQYKIAMLFNVSRSCVLNIKRGTVWGDVTETRDTV